MNDGCKIVICLTTLSVISNGELGLHFLALTVCRHSENSLELFCLHAHIWTHYSFSCCHRLYVCLSVSLPVGLRGKRIELYISTPLSSMWGPGCIKYCVTNNVTDRFILLYSHSLHLSSYSFIIVLTYVAYCAYCCFYHCSMY